MTTPLANLLSQFQRDASAFSMLVNRRTLGEQGLDMQIEEMRQAMAVRWAIVRGLMKEGTE